MTVHISKERKRKIQKKVIEACKSDACHTKKLAKAKNS